MRALQRTQDHRHVVKSVMLALERQFVAGKALEDEFEGLVIDFAGLREIETVSASLKRRDAASDPELEPPAAHLIEHADFLDQAQRMIERQEIDEGAEAQRLGALRHGREKEPGRGGAAERRRVVLGDVVAIDAAAVIGFDQLEPIGVERAKRPAPIVHVIEHAEFHAASRRVDHGAAPATAALALEWARVAWLYNFERRLA